MKRGILLAIVLMFVLAFAVMAYAQENENDTDDDSIEISASAEIEAGGDDRSGNSNTTDTRTKTVTTNDGIKTVIEERVKTRDGALVEERTRIKIMNEAEQRRKVLEFRERVKNGRGIVKIEGRGVGFKELNETYREIILGKINARTWLNLTLEDLENKTMLRARLSNGRNAEVKVMPDVASERALERLRAKCESRNCTIELKEVGKNNETRLAYVIETDKDSRVLFIFKKRMIVKAEVDAETGEVIYAKKPWWAFIAKEKNEGDGDSDADESLSLSVDVEENEADDNSEMNDSSSNNTG